MHTTDWLCFFLSFFSDALLKPPGWVNAIPGGWDSRDDAMLLIGVFLHGAPVTTEAWQIIAADPALNLKEKLKGLRTNWALRTGQGLTQDDNKDELVKVSRCLLFLGNFPQKPNVFNYTRNKARASTSTDSNGCFYSTGIAHHLTSEPAVAENQRAGAAAGRSQGEQGGGRQVEGRGEGGRGRGGRRGGSAEAGEQRQSAGGEGVGGCACLGV